jgi:hypothetical protein
MESKMKYVSPLELEAEWPFPATSGRSMTLDENVNLMSRLALISPSIREAAVPGLPALTPPQARRRAISACSTHNKYK